MLRLAFFALPFQMRQRSRSTSSTITVLARIRPRSSAGNPLAVWAACWIRIAEAFDTTHQIFLLIRDIGPVTRSVLVTPGSADPRVALARLR